MAVPAAAAPSAATAVRSAFDEFAKVVQIFLNGSFNVLRLAAAAMAKNDPPGDR